MEQFKNREYYIVRFLLSQRKPVTANQIAKAFNVSLRTIRYDLERIEYVLESRGLKLEKKNNVGCWFEDPQKATETLNTDFNNPDEPSWRILSKEERVKKIISMLLLNNDYLTTEDISYELDVSRSTIVRDLEDAEEWFKQRNIEVEKKPRWGILVVCGEKQRRNAMMDFIEESENNIDLASLLKNSTNTSETNYLDDVFVNNFIKQLFEGISAEVFRDFCEKIANKLNVTYPDETITNLTIHFGIAKKRLKEGKHISMDPVKLQELKNSKEFKILKENIRDLEEAYEIEIPESEIGFMSLHLIGAKITRAEEDTNNNEEENEIVTRYIAKVSEILGQNLNDDEILRNNLLLHLKPALYRLKNDLRISNPILDQIKEKYSRVYNASRQAADELEKRLHTRIIDDEAGFIALHVGASIERSKKNNELVYRTLVACGSSLGTTKLLSSRLVREFDEIEIVDEVPVYELTQRINQDIDLVITTVPVKDVVLKPVITVSPLLNYGDIEKIKITLQGLKGNKIKNNGDDLDDIVDIIKQFATVYDPQGLKKALSLVMEDRKQVTKKTEVQKLLSESVNEKRIEIARNNTWEKRADDIINIIYKNFNK